MKEKEKIKILKREINYYSKIYSPNCSKIKELKKKLKDLSKK